MVNGAKDRIDVLDDANGTYKTSLTFGGFGNPNSVAVKNGLVAVAVGATKTDAGRVYFFNAASGAPVGTADVGALPDMVTFTPDGSKVIVANEGEPDYYGTGGTDPVGSVSIVDAATQGVTTAGYGLLVANEVSGTTSYYVITQVPIPAPLALFAVGMPLIVTHRRPQSRTPSLLVK